jgi:GNAT superfamily N-acetyltransferase
MTEFSRVLTKRLSNVDSAMYRQMVGLTEKGPDWDMRPTLVSLKKGEYENKAPALVHYIRDEKGRVAAWSVSFDENGEPWAYFYVRKAYRGNGLGIRLFKTAIRSNTRRFGKRTNVGSYGAKTRNFFMRANRELNNGRGCVRMRIHHWKGENQ